MPEALTVDWDKVRTEYLSNKCPVEDIADKYGIKLDTLYKRARRYGWRTGQAVVKKATQYAAQHAIKQHIRESLASVKPELDSAIQDWVKKSKDTAGKLIDKVNKELDKEQSPEDLQRLAGALDRGDGVGRRSLGMDKLESAMGGNRVLLSIAAVGVISPDGGLACLPVDYGQGEAVQPIEAEVISEGESFPVGDAQPSEPGQGSFPEPTTPIPTG